MPLICHNGQVAISDMMDLSNQNETDIAANTANIDLNLTSLIAHGTEIIDLDNRLDLIEGGPSAAGLASEVAALEINLGNATINISNIESNIDLVEKSITDLETTLTSTSDAVDVNILNIATNTADILLLSGGATGLTDADAMTITSPTNLLITEADILSQLQTFTSSYIDTVASVLLVTNSDLYASLTNFSIIRHKVAVGANGGSSIAGVWTVRELNDLHENYLGITLVGNRLQLDVGTYMISGSTIATGAYHQSRIFDENGGVVVCLGSSQNNGQSIINGVFTLTTAGSLVLQTQVDVSVPGIGFGEPNPFDEGIFSTLKIERIGD